MIHIIITVLVVLMVLFSLPALCTTFVVAINWDKPQAKRWEPKILDNLYLFRQGSILLSCILLFACLVMLAVGAILYNPKPAQYEQVQEQLYRRVEP